MNKKIVAMMILLASSYVNAVPDYSGALNNITYSKIQLGSNFDRAIDAFSPSELESPDMDGYKAYHSQHQGMDRNVRVNEDFTVYGGTATNRVTGIVHYVIRGDQRSHEAFISELIKQYGQPKKAFIKEDKRMGGVVTASAWGDCFFNESGLHKDQKEGDVCIAAMHIRNKAGHTEVINIDDLRGQRDNDALFRQYLKSKPTSWVIDGVELGGHFAKALNSTPVRAFTYKDSYPKKRMYYHIEFERKSANYNSTLSLNSGVANDKVVEIRSQKEIPDILDIYQLMDQTIEKYGTPAGRVDSEDRFGKPESIACWGNCKINNGYVSSADLSGGGYLAATIFYGQSKTSTFVKLEAYDHSSIRDNENKFDAMNEAESRKESEDAKVKTKSFRLY